MNEVVRITLAKIIARHARPPELDVRRCEGLLRDYLAGEYKKEINVLVSALREQVVADLLASDGRMPKTVLLARCARKLQDHTGIAEDLARWSVESWALALGVIAEDTSSTVEKTAPIAPPVPQAWYYTLDGRNRIGPVSAAELKKLADAGKLSPDNYVREERMAKWMHARSVKGLFSASTPRFASPEVWYYSLGDGHSIGPVSFSELKKLAATGQLSPHHWVGKEGMAEWKYAFAINNLFPAAVPCSIPTAQPAPAASIPSRVESLKQVEDGREPSMARQAAVQSDGYEEPRRRDAALRPRWLREVVGQKAIVQRLSIALTACKKLREPVPHILFDGPPGIGKTTLATVLPNELDTSIQRTSGPTLRKPADLLPFLTNIEEGSVLFIDEIHRMPRAVEEFIYPAMEAFSIDVVLGEGMDRRTINLRLKPFTLIGATTRNDILSGSLRDHFKMHEHLEYYTVEELAEIVRINAHKLQTPITEDAALELAQRSRGTPRVVNSLLCWSRRYAEGEANGIITLEVARAAMDMAEVDRHGLGKQDRRYLELLVGVHGGGPVGVESLAASMALPVDTLKDEIEPYLLREQFIARTTRGRVAMARAYQVLGRPMKHAPPEEHQPGLFD